MFFKGLIHEQKPYEEAYSYQIETAKKYWQRVVNIPCSTKLTHEEVNRIVSLII